MELYDPPVGSRETAAAEPCFTSQELGLAIMARFFLMQMRGVLEPVLSILTIPAQIRLPAIREWVALGELPQILNLGNKLLDSPSESGR